MLCGDFVVVAIHDLEGQQPTAKIRAPFHPQRQLRRHFQALADVLQQSISAPLLAIDRGA